MNSISGDYFTVTVNKKELVAAELPKLEYWLPLSNLDICLLPVKNDCFFFCYQKPTIGDNLMITFGFMVEVLKKAMAQALIPYYVLAGEVVPNSMGEPELLCNNRGVDFIEAYANIDLKDLNFYNAEETVGGKFVPEKKHGVLAVQATELKCGGLVVGCTFDHRIADGYSINMFLVSWVEIAQSKPLSFLPSFRRSLLSPRHSSSIDPSFKEWYMPIPTLPPPKEPQPGVVAAAANDDHYISRIYHVAADQINQIQLLASTNTNTCKRPTKLESFSAFLWKMIAKSCTDEKICKLGIAVDGRMRLSLGGGGGDDNTDKLANYFGNVVSIPYSTKKVDELIEKPISWIANEVHGFLESIMREEHFLGLIEYVEANRPQPTLMKLLVEGNNKDGPALVVSSGLRFPQSNGDFGWGLPVIASRFIPFGKYFGLVMPMLSRAGNGDWVVYMCLLKSQLEFMENEAAHIFRPFHLSSSSSSTTQGKH